MKELFLYRSACTIKSNTMFMPVGRVIERIKRSCLNIENKKYRSQKCVAVLSDNFQIYFSDLFNILEM